MTVIEKYFLYEYGQSNWLHPKHFHDLCRKPILIY
jgi:hypothetical protein